MKITTASGLTLNFYNGPKVRTPLNEESTSENYIPPIMDSDEPHCPSCKESKNFEITGDMGDEYFIVCEGCGQLMTIETAEGWHHPYVDQLADYIENKFDVTVKRGGEL